MPLGAFGESGFLGNMIHFEGMREEVPKLRLTGTISELGYSPLDPVTFSMS